MFLYVQVYIPLLGLGLWFGIHVTSHSEIDTGRF